KALQFGQQLAEVRLLWNLILLRPGNLARLVDDEDGALRDAVGAHDAVGGRDGAFRVEVAQQVERDAAERFGPRLLGRTGIHADAEHVRVERVELRLLALIALHLHGADRRERERVKRDHDILPAAEVRKANGLAALVAQLEIRSERAGGNHTQVSAFYSNVLRCFAADGPSGPCCSCSACCSSSRRPPPTTPTGSGIGSWATSACSCAR